MTVLVDDPAIIESVRRLAAQLGMSEEEAIGHAVTAELAIRKRAASSDGLKEPRKEPRPTRGSSDAPRDHD